MTSNGKSRWADDEADAALDAQRKKDKEEKKRAKLEKQRKLQEAQARQQQAAAQQEAHTAEPTARPLKRRKLSGAGSEPAEGTTEPAKLLRFTAPGWGPCRHVDAFEKLNHIEEGSYGWVSRAKEVATGEVVALKKLKMDNTNDGFPVTGLREIQTLMACRHPGVVTLREVVIGDTLDE
jgi:cell division cycle 2-like protein